MFIVDLASDRLVPIRLLWACCKAARYRGEHCATAVHLMVARERGYETLGPNTPRTFLWPSIFLPVKLTLKSTLLAAGWQPNLQFAGCGTDAVVGQLSSWFCY